MENRKFLVLGGAAGFILLLFVPFLFSAVLRACSAPAAPKNTNGNQTVQVVQKKLTVWGVEDQRELYEGIFQSFSQNHPGFLVDYRTFSDLKEYHDLLIDAIAEGRGPDIAMVENTWVLKDKNKFSPFPVGLREIDAKKYRETFVDVAAKDLILNDDAGVPQIWGFPASVDTLAIYYNKKHFRDYVLSSALPADLWKSAGGNDIIGQVIKMTKPDLSFERFQLSGMAMGRSDNISMGIDILSLLLLQFNTKLYDEAFTNTILPNSSGIDPTTNESVFPAQNALQLYTSFGLNEFKHYSWNELITKKEEGDDEIGVFAGGKVAMIFGYSSTYDKIIATIKRKKERGKPTMSEDDIGIEPVPRINEGLDRVTYASYFPFVVTSTSGYKQEAWDLILDLVDRSAQELYFSKAHKPTSLYDLVDAQSIDPLYGVFALQVSSAQSLPLVEPFKQREILAQMVDDVINGRKDARQAITEANTRMKCLLDQYNRVQDKEGINCLRVPLQ